MIFPKIMKKFFSLLFSSKTTLILLLVFTVSIAVATFVEDKYDTKTAQILIYSAWWFELVIGLLVLNYIGQLKQYNFFSKGKLGGLIFHTGFVVLIIGAAVTRYFGQEGTMHIRENESSNTITSYDPYLQVKVSGPKGDFFAERAVKISSVGGNNFSKKIESGYDKPVTISFNRFIKNAGDTVIENLPDGEDMLALQISSGGNGQGVYLKKGERINRGGVFVSFADTLHDSDVVITEEQGKLIARSKTEIFVVDRESMKPDSNQRGTSMEFRENYIFQCEDVLFTLS